MPDSLLSWAYVEASEEIMDIKYFAQSKELYTLGRAVVVLVSHTAPHWAQASPIVHGQVSLGLR